MILGFFSALYTAGNESNSDWVIRDWDLELKLSPSTPTLLSADHSFSESDFILIFDKIKEMKDKASSTTNSENSSMASTTSTANSECVEAMEELLKGIFDFETPTPEQEKNRQSFINTLHALEGKFDTEIFQKE